MKKENKLKMFNTIVSIIILIMFCLPQTNSQEIYPEVITTEIKQITPEILNKVDRFYEISEKSLKIGYNITLNTESVFRTSIDEYDRYIIATNFSKNQILLTFLGGGKKLINQPIKTDEYIIFKIGDLNLKFMLNSANKTHAEVSLNLFEEKIPKNVDYFQLFDIQTKLLDQQIYESSELSAIVEFINFGEGPSNVKIIYSIINSEEKELFTAIDEKIIETNEIIIKKFDTLDIPNGNYKIRTTIYYGDNQEATSEESFVIKPIPKYQIIKQPLFFIVIVIIGLALVMFLKKKEASKTSSIS